MSDRTNPPSPPPPHRRRSSIVDLFSPRSNSTATAVSSSPPSATVPSTPSVLQRRGTSITALGLTTTPQNQPSPYTAFARQRRASIATSSTSSSPDFKNSFGDEPAVIEEDDPSRATLHPPASPSFARRVSFGAQALRDVKTGGSPGASGGGEGFNWSEALRDRTKRSPSFSSGNPFASGVTRPRSASVSNPEPPKEIPKPVETPTRMKKPDHLGERMLRGDFMMD